MFALTRAEHARGQDLAEQLLSLAQRWRDPAFEVPAHFVLGIELWWQGECVAARDHLEAGLRLYDPQQHRNTAVLYGVDSEVVCGANLSVVLWALGYRPAARPARRVRPWPCSRSTPGSGAAPVPAAAAPDSPAASGAGLGRRSGGWSPPPAPTAAPPVARRAAGSPPLSGCCRCGCSDGPTPRSARQGGPQRAPRSPAPCVRAALCAVRGATSYTPPPGSGHA